MQDVGTRNGKFGCHQYPICDTKGQTQELSFDRLISGNGHVSLRDLRWDSDYTNGAIWEVTMRDACLNTFYAFTSLSAFRPVCPPS